MKIDKCKSLKNTIGVFLFTACLSLSFSKSNALAYNKIETDNLDSGEAKIEDYIFPTCLCGVVLLSLNSQFLLKRRENFDEIKSFDRSNKLGLTFNDTVREKKFQSLEELADDMIKQFEDDPLSFRMSKITIDSLGEVSIEQLETMLMAKIPNLIITHSDTDTDEDIVYQVRKINEMFDRNETPYFIDFSKIKKLK